MPTIARFGAVSLRMYADEHRPPHFHVVGPDFQVVVRIADLVVIAGHARRNRIAAVLEWVAEHRQMLALKWVELTERSD